jgi:perosamine synthetase
MNPSDASISSVVPSAGPVPSRDTYLPFGQPQFGDDEIAAVTRVLRSGWIGMGPETIAFEGELAQVVEAPHVVTVSSCTAAMSLCLRLLGIGAGDEVICPSLTWCSTANAALYQGAQPVFCDVDPANFCTTPETVLPLITPRTKAVMVVHFGGQAVDVTSLRAALPPRIAIVEDAAHAFGARYPDDRPVGSSGNLVCFSFYANKNLSTGEGGAIALFDSALADRLRSLRQHALPIDAWKRFTHAQTVLLSQQLTELGYKANYTDLQAALGRVQLRRLPDMQTHRRQLAERYLQRLQPIKDRLVPQAGLAGAAHALHLFPVRIVPEGPRQRDDLLVELRQRNIGATIHYAPLHLMPLYRGGRAPGLPVTETLGRQIITLPISASMQLADVDYVCDHLSELVT